MSHQLQIAIIFILAILNGGMIYIWIKELRNMDKRKNTFWSEGTDDGKPYTSIQDWVDEIRHLIWPSIILILLIIIITIILLTQ